MHTVSYLIKENLKSRERERLIVSDQNVHIEHFSAENRERLKSIAVTLFLVKINYINKRETITCSKLEYS